MNEMLDALLVEIFHFKKSLFHISKTMLQQQNQHFSHLVSAVYNLIAKTNSIY